MQVIIQGSRRRNVILARQLMHVEKREADVLRLQPGFVSCWLGSLKSAAVPIPSCSSHESDQIEFVLQYIAGYRQISARPSSDHEMIVEEPCSM